MAGISDKAVKTNYAENKNRYNDGSEIQNKEFSDGTGLEAYDADFRMYDPQIGRFWQMDPLADINADYSPYSFANDNPILLNDPLGLKSDTQTLPQVVVTPPPPAPRSTVTASRANTSGSAPDVASTAGPAPSRSHALIQSEKDKESYAKFNKLLGCDPFDFKYQQDHYVMREPTFFERLFNNEDNGLLLGYNWKNNPVYQPSYSGTVAPEISTTGIGSLVKIAEVAEEGITVLGSYGKYLELGEQLGAKTFNIPDAIWKTMTEEQRWAANVKFLSRAIARGDRFVLSNSALEARPGTYFYRELQYLYTKGYKVAADGMSLFK
jgi:RHS repeat-associated protein